jgi:hypothetical protein
MSQGIIKLRDLSAAIQTGVHAASDALGQLRLANFTLATTSCRVQEINPLSEVYTPATLMDETNYNDAGPSVVSTYSDMDGFTRPSWQYDINQGTGTIQLEILASWQNDGTAPAACAYENMTLALTGMAAIVGTGTGVIADNAGVLEGAKYVETRITVNTDPADDGDFTIFFNKLWR